MKKLLIKASIIIFIFILPKIVFEISELLEKHFLVRILNVSSYWSISIMFILLFLVSAFSYTRYKNKIGSLRVSILLILYILIYISYYLTENSLKYTIKLSPFYISIFAAIAAGYFYSIRERLKFIIPLLLFVIPLVLSTGLNELWVHKIEFGNFFGDVKNSRIIPFEMKNKEGETVTEKNLLGNYVLLDFWFIGCPPCWDKFPELQRLYNKYQSNHEVKIFAVNRPMRRDKPGEMYTSIEEKNYTFPVLEGNKQIIDDFDVYKYPTVVLLNKRSEIVFMGKIEGAEIKLQNMLILEDK